MHQYSLLDVANCHAIDTYLAVTVGQEKSEDLYKCYVYELSDSVTAVRAQNAVASACQANFVNLRDSVRKRTREPHVIAQPLPETKETEETVVDEDGTGFGSTIAALHSLAHSQQPAPREAFVNETYESSPMMSRKANALPDAEEPVEMETSILLNRGGGADRSMYNHAAYSGGASSGMFRREESSTDIINIAFDDAHHPEDAGTSRGGMRRQDSSTDVLELHGHRDASSSTDHRSIYNPSSATASSVDQISARRGKPTRPPSLSEQASAIKISVDTVDEEVIDLDAVADHAGEEAEEEGGERSSLFELEELLASEQPPHGPHDMSELEELLLQDTDGTES